MGSEKEGARYEDFDKTACEDHPTAGCSGNQCSAQFAEKLCGGSDAVIFLF